MQEQIVTEKEKKMKKNNRKNRVKRFIASAMLVCMLFGAARVGGNFGIMPYGDSYDEVTKL